MNNHVQEELGVLEPLLQVLVVFFEVRQSKLLFLHSPAVVAHPTWAGGGFLRSYFKVLVDPRMVGQLPFL